jgi:hypothetical protein
MNVVAFNGSPRKDGNTHTLLRTVLAEIEAEGIRTELVQLGGRNIRGCVACFRCFENRDRRCAMDKDILFRSYTSVPMDKSPVDREYLNICAAPSSLQLMATLEPGFSKDP